MNDDLLVLQYPAYQNKINEARKAGYNDEEIGSAMNSRIESALANGYTRYEIDERLGITDDSRFAHLNALIRSKQNAVGFIQNKTPEQMESIFKSNRKKGIDLNKTLHMVDLSSLNDETAVNRYLESLGTPKYKEADRDRGPAFEWNKKLNESAGALTKNLYTRTVGGITAGFLSSAEGMSRGGAFLSDVLGYEDGYKKASEFADFLESGTEGYMSMLYKDRDINLLDSVMQGIGSNGMFLFAGITASKLIGYAGGTALLAGAKIQTVEKLARYAGASIQATTESLSEAGGVYKEVLDRTGDKSAAMSAASWNFWLNMPSNFLSDKFAFWGEDTFLKGVLPKVAKSATMQNVLYKGAKAAAGLVSEGAQETFQGAIGEHYGKGTDWTALDLSEIAYQQGLPGGIVGAIMGYGMSPKFQAMVTEHNERIAQKERIIHVRDVGTVVQNVKTELLKTGRDEETANVESAIWGARASTAAKQQGITPMEWLERQGLSVNNTTAQTDGALFQTASEELQTKQRREELISAYDNAIANNDMESATEIVNEYAALNGYTKDLEHKSHHEAPYKDEEGFNFSLADIVAGSDNVLSPSDFFTHPNKYISMNESESVESLNAVKAAIEAENKFRSGKTKKEPTITVYRAVPQNVDESSPRNADWVTPSKKYAKLHGEKVFNGQYKIQSMKVKASDLYWNADSINEWGVDDGHNYGYKNTENNRKLFDAVTYDDNGTMIPLAQRFNDEMKETYYQPLNNDVNPDDMVDFVDLRGVKEFKIDTSNAKAFVAKWNDSGLEIRKNISGDKATAKLYSKNKKHIVWSSYIPGRHGKERRKALSAFDKVLNGAVMIETFKNKKSDKQDIEFVHRFYLPIITEEGESLLRIVALEKNNTSRVSDVELYDITKEKTPLTSPTHGINANTQLNEQIRTLGSKISIRDLLKNVKDSNGDRYFRQEDLAEQQYRASVTFQDGKSLVSMMKTADRSSFLHESGHIFLKDMADFINSGKASEQDIADWNTLLKWFDISDWNTLSQEERTKAHEQFARGIESYFWNGVSPVKSLVGVFNKFSAWLREIYKSVQELNVEMSPDVNDVFNRLFAVDDIVGDVVSRKVTDSELMADIAKEAEEASSQTEEDTPEEEPRTNAQIDASYDPDWTDEEIAAYEAARENARAAVELDDTGYDPAMWDITQENVNETFDKQEYAKEQQAMEQAAYQAFIDFGNQILENGGILYSSLVNAVGQEKAQEIRKKVPYLMRNNFKEIADIASDMGISVDEIVDRLDSRPAKPMSEKFAPIVEVDTSTVPWILERFGIDGGRQYFGKRLRYIEGMQSEAEKNYSLAKTEDNLQSMERIKQEYKAYVAESKLIKEALRDIESIEKTLEPYSQKAGAPITWKEMVEKAKEQAVRWTQVTVKEAIYSVTDKTRVSDLVSEYDAMREAYKMSEQDSRRAFRSGKKDGMIIAAARQKELTKQRLKRAETRRYIMQLVKGIDTATVGNMIFAKKQEIVKILDDYDLKFRSSKTVENRKTILDYIHEGIDEAKKTGDNMSVEFMDFAESELRILSRKTLNNMTIEDLIELHTKVTDLRREGIKEYRLWEAKNRQELDGMKESLFGVTGGPQSGNTRGIIVPGKTKRGAQISRIGAALLETLTPSRVFDRLDNFADFKGAFHNIFMRNADEAEDRFLRAKNKRLKVMEDIFNTYQMTQAKLAETRLKFTDAESDEETILTLDHCLHIYIGWHNALTRDALMYGNRISQTVADSAFASLSENEKNFALAVMNEQGGENTDRYENVLLDTFNIGLNREKYYTRMYRTQWTNSKGDSVDEGIKGILDSLAMEYSIRKIYADKGSSKDRRIISELYQEPIALGLVNVWNRSMVEHEHLIAYGKLVKQLHAIVNEQTDRNKAEHIAGMKETIENVYGTDVQRWMVGYINRLANPDFYKSFKASDQMMRKVRANVGVAYLWGNIASFMKQPQAIAYYLRDAGLVHLVSSVAEFTAHPVRTMEMVWDLDPQVKDQKINRFLEELKVSNEDGQLGKIKKYGEWGFAPMQWTDMLTRCIGWNAVYKNELAKGSSQKDAAYAAQRATLNTQNAAHPKELPSYMATGNEMLNLLTQFTNQANKIFGVAVHELYGDFKKGRYHKGFLTLMSLFIGAYLMSLLKNGENPADSKEAFKRLFIEETLGNIPLMGSGFQAYASGFSGGATPYDDVASDLAKALFKGFDNEFEDSAMALYTAWSILLGGTPVTAVKRAIKFAETGDLSDLTGLLRRHKSKKSIVL